MKYDPERTWLTADVSHELGAAFSAAARKQHRTARAQLRVLVEEFIDEMDRAARYPIETARGESGRPMS